MLEVGVSLEEVSVMLEVEILLLEECVTFTWRSAPEDGHEHHGSSEEPH
jgi:hypothetical protein